MDESPIERPIAPARWNLEEVKLPLEIDNEIPDAWCEVVRSVLIHGYHMITWWWNVFVPCFSRMISQKTVLKPTGQPVRTYFLDVGESGDFTE